MKHNKSIILRYKRLKRKDLSSLVN